MPRQVRSTTPSLLLGACALLLVACGPSEPVIVAQPAPAAFTVAHVAGLTHTANTSEIEAGQLAASQATNAAVRDFAQRMVTDHTQARTRGETLWRSEGISMQHDATTRQLETNSRQTLDALRAYEGVAFDRAYMDSQISMHDWLLRTIDRTLIPAARNADVERYLRDFRSSVSAHLDAARQIRSQVGS